MAAVLRAPLLEGRAATFPIGFHTPQVYGLVMLIDLCPPITINPYEYPTTLAIRVETENRPECGVFAGKHNDFTRDEEGKTVPVIDDDGTGRKTYLLDREPGSGSHCRVWHYAAVGWDNGIYIEHPSAHTLTLREYDHDREQSSWAVSVRSGSHLFQLLLADYEPGAVARGVVSLGGKEAADS